MNAIERITLRLPQNLMKILKKESYERTLPINALITRILHKNLIQEAKFNALPIISIPPQMFDKIIDKLDIATIEDLSKSGSKIAKKYFALVNQGYTTENIVSEYFTMLAKHYGWFVYHFDKTDRKYRLVFDTYLGPKWAKFVFNYVKTILISAKIQIEQESVDDNVIIFMFTDYALKSQLAQ